MTQISESAAPAGSAVILRTAVAATLVVLALAATICAAFDAHVLTTWVGFAFMAATPAQIVLALLWQANHPPAIARLPQPAKGLALTAATVLAGAGFGTLLFYAGGGGVGPPTPMLMMMTMLTVVTTLWLVPVWHGWPLSMLTSNRSALGCTILVGAYAVAYLLFVLLFDFSFLSQAPIYVESLDPKGLLNAWIALSFLVTTVAVIVVCILLDFWPVTAVVPARRQPAFGLAATLWILAVSAGVYTLFTRVVGLDPVQHLVRVPVALIFGAFLVHIMTQHRLLERWPQPRRGFALTALASGFAVLTHALYAGSAPLLARQALPAGPPTYELEIWVANAMLGITFPLMIVVAEYFEFWPLVRQQRIQARPSRE